MNALDAATCYRVLEARDRRFDGRFFVAVTSTGIYCRPICPARTPKFEHCFFFRTPRPLKKPVFAPVCGAAQKFRRNSPPGAEHRIRSREHSA
jgi:AraC family transcriptional regulator of adaptative response / DNA-3-methyladenine glycosylase II